MAEVSIRILMITPKISYIKELVEPEHQLFHHRINSCSYNLDRHHLSRILVDNMIHHQGIGISANQIGIWERAFVMMTNIEKEETITCFNPKILKTYAKKEIMEEGCLSYPNLFLRVERPCSIVAKWEDENEVIHKTKLEGFSARIFLHEYDHMEGIDFTQRKVNDF